MAITVTNTQTESRMDFTEFSFPTKYLSSSEMDGDPQIMDLPPSNEPTPTPNSKSISPLLTLPLEIRLQIYSHLLPIHPAKHPHLSPNTDYPPPTSSAYFLRVLSPALALSYPDFEPAGKTTPSSFQISSSKSSSPKQPPSNIRGHGCGQIPSSVLRSCKQIYDESRLLPWQTNEFIFINWFCSGVYAARAFLRSLQPWQRDAMRWARLEVLGRDLKDAWVATMVGGRAGGGEWIDLCRLWGGSDSPADEGKKVGGLQGLRLGIKGRVGAGLMASMATTDGAVLSATDGGTPPPSSSSSTSTGTAALPPLTPSDSRGIVLKRHLGVLDVSAEWVTKGLASMSALRWLEVEIEDDEVERGAKVDFCVKLEERLSGLRGGKEGVEVVFVEKAEEEDGAGGVGGKRGKKKKVPAWGELADDYIWALDS